MMSEPCAERSEAPANGGGRAKQALWGHHPLAEASR